VNEQPCRPAEPPRRPEPSPADRCMAAVERAHTAYTSGRTSHTQYVAAIAAALTLWRNP